jgi:hypothetical protein
MQLAGAVTNVVARASVHVRNGDGARFQGAAGMCAGVREAGPGEYRQSERKHSRSYHLP